METYFLFIVKASCSISVFYLFGVMLFRNDTKFKLHRWYLLSSVIIALMMPLNKISLRLPEIKEQAAQTAPQPINTTAVQGTNSSVIPERTPVLHITAATATKPSFNYQSVFTITYWIAAGIVFSRILYSLGLLALGFARSERRKYGKFTIIYHPVHGASYSFFKWVFISNDVKDKLEKQNIINHELVHASQYHSIDILAVELLSAVMWFNPFIWLMRRWMQQLHEYLADEGVLQSGADVLEYQALLVNQVAGDGFICLPSGFNQSLIKKRLTMMTKTRINRKTGYKLLALLPLAGMMFLAVSFTNKKEIEPEKVEKSAALNVYNPLKLEMKVPNGNQTPNLMDKRDTIKSKVSDGELMPPPQPPFSPDEQIAISSTLVTAVAPTKMNVLYLGVDNPLSIAVSGVPADKIFPSITNGTIRLIGNSYIVNPRQLGNVIIHVFAEINGKKVLTGAMEFRVKQVPDPVARVAGKKSGIINKNILLAQSEVQVLLTDFDFDMEFKITQFTVSASVGGHVLAEVSKSAKITEAEKDIIRQLKKGDLINFTGITVEGPDGKMRDLSPIVLEIE